MANSVSYKDTSYKVGDMLSIDYRIVEGDKERVQTFKGILIKIKGDTEQNRMITVRKISNIGLGVERIIPLSSPYIVSMKKERSSSNQKAKIYYIRNLSDQELRKKLYSSK